MIFSVSSSWIPKSNGLTNNSYQVVKIRNGNSLPKPLEGNPGESL